MAKAFLDALSLPRSSDPLLLDKDRLVWMADYLSGLIEPSSGSVRESFNSIRYLSGGDGHIALLALLLASGHLHPRFKDYLEVAIGWVSAKQDEEGSWHWGYEDSGPIVDPGSLLEVPPITDIKLLDINQCMPMVLLTIYSSFFGEDDFVCAHGDKFLRGLNLFIDNNYDTYDGFFFSHHKYQSGAWSVVERQTAMGQLWAYLGLRSAYALAGTNKHKLLADRIQNEFNTAFWSPVLGCYSTSRSGPAGTDKVKDQVTLRADVQGFAPWVLGPSLTDAPGAIAKVVSWLRGDGITVSVPGYNDHVNNTSWLMLGLKAMGSNEPLRTTLRQKIRDNILEFYPDPKLGDGRASEGLGSSTGWAWLALSDEPGCYTWWV